MNYLQQIRALEEENQKLFSELRWYEEQEYELDSVIKEYGSIEEMKKEFEEDIKWLRFRVEDLENENDNLLVTINTDIYPEEFISPTNLLEEQKFEILKELWQLPLRQLIRLNNLACRCISQRERVKCGFMCREF